MSRNRFIVPSTTRLDITDGDWIEVKTDLNTGELKQLEGAGVKPPVMLNGSPWSAIDWGVYEVEKVRLYLTDWSFKNAEDKPVKVNLDSIRALDPIDFEEVSKAITKHIKDRAQEKKDLRDQNLKTILSPVETDADEKSS